MGLEMVGRLGRRMGRAGESGEMMTGGGGGGGRGKFLHTGEIEFLIFQNNFSSISSKTKTIVISIIKSIHTGTLFVKIKIIFDNFHQKTSN